MPFLIIFNPLVSLCLHNLCSLSLRRGVLYYVADTLSSSVFFSVVISLSLIQGRDHLTHEKKRFAHEHAQMKKLEDVVKELKPTAIIGIYIYI